MSIAKFRKNELTFSNSEGLNTIFRIKQTGYVFWSFDLLLNGEVAARLSRKTLSLGYKYNYVDRSGRDLVVKYSPGRGLSCRLGAEGVLVYRRCSGGIDMKLNGASVFSGEYVCRKKSEVLVNFFDDGFVELCLCLLHLGELHRRHAYS